MQVRLCIGTLNWIKFKWYQILSISCDQSSLCRMKTAHCKHLLTHYEHALWTRWLPLITTLWVLRLNKVLDEAVGRLRIQREGLIQRLQFRRPIKVTTLQSETVSMEILSDVIESDVNDGALSRWQVVNWCHLPNSVVFNGQYLLKIPLWTSLRIWSVNMI